MTKEEILSSIKGCAETLGRVPTLVEVRRATKLKKHMVQKHFLTYGSALAQCGLARRGKGYEADTRTLFESWAGLARKLGRLPTMGEYEMEGTYSVRPLTRRYKGWTHVPAGMLEYARAQKLEAEWSDVVEMVTRYLAKAAAKERPEGRNKRHGLGSGSAGPGFGRPGLETSFGRPAFGPGFGSDFGKHTRLNLGPAYEPGFGSDLGKHTGREIKPNGEIYGPDSPLWQTRFVPGQPVYGWPLLPTPLSHSPTNELGVVFLFGSRTSCSHCPGCGICFFLAATNPGTCFSMISGVIGEPLSLSGRPSGPPIAMTR